MDKRIASTLWHILVNRVLRSTREVIRLSFEGSVGVKIVVLPMLLKFGGSATRLTNRIPTYASHERGVTVLKDRAFETRLLAFGFHP